MKKISVLIADDHKLLSETLSYIIDQDPMFNVMATCCNSDEAIEIIGLEKPDIVLMDINMGPVSGIAVTQQLKEMESVSRVIGMSVHAEPAYVKQMMLMGARGYVTKNSPKDEILAAMKKVWLGETYICQEIKDILGQQLYAGNAEPTGIRSLTHRELQIVEFVKTGNSSKEIGVELDIKTKTVEVHRHNIMKKLKLKNVAALVQFFNSHEHQLVRAC